MFYLFSAFYLSIIWYTNYLINEILIRYFFHAAGHNLIVLIGVVSLVFCLFNILPSDPARMMLGQRNDEASLEAIRKDLGLDKPVYIQYFKYLNDISPVSIHCVKNRSSFFFLDKTIYKNTIQITRFNNWNIFIKVPYLLRSYQSKQPVTEIIFSTLSNTFILASASIIFGSVLGIFLGLIAGLKKNSIYDKLVLIISALGMSVPSFFAAILIAWLFGFVLSGYTGLNLTGNLFVIDDYGNGIKLELKNLILPSITLGIRPLAVIMQLSRSSMIEVMEQDYIRTAYSKGLKTWQVIKNHALRNAMNPVVTSVSGWFASLMSGVVFIEYIFGWKGIGYVIVDALNNYDLPVVLGCVLVLSVIFVFINLMVDIIYAWLDPRVRI